MQLFQTQKILSIFFFLFFFFLHLHLHLHLLNLHSILNICEEKIALMVAAFLNLQTTEKKVT